MWGVIFRRLLFAVPLLFLVSALSFFLLSLAHVNLAALILGPTALPKEIATLRHQLGLDLALSEQYWRWLHHALSGNLGTSVLNQQVVTTAISSRLPVTLSLILGALLMTLVVGVPLGVFSAVHGGALGRFVDALSLVGFALPSIWLGAMLIELFAVKVHWLPAVGYVPLTQSPQHWLGSLAMPVTALALGSVASLAKNTREAMLDSLASEHIRMAWANGVPARSIYFVYAMRDAAMRVVTILSLITIGLLGGTVLIENVFALPGLGSLLVSASEQHDEPIVQGIAVVFTVIVIAVNLVTDLSYSWLDPRVRSR